MTDKSFVNIDLASLPVPDAFTNVVYEEILAEAKDKFREIEEEKAEGELEFSALDIESDPAVITLEVSSYHAMTTRKVVNDGIRAVLLAHATGTDLDHLAATFHVRRLVVDPGNPDATPPVAPVMEKDAVFRARIAQAPEGYSVAGPRGAYEFHARSASPDVKDVLAKGTGPAQLSVTILSNTGDGVPDQDLIDIVTSHLSDEDIRPVGDQVTVQGASVISYTITAEISIYAGPDMEIVRSTAEENLNTYVNEQHRLGGEVNRSGIDAALHIGGVHRVTLTDWTDQVAAENEAPYCTSITLTVTEV